MTAVRLHSTSSSTEFLLESDGCRWRHFPAGRAARLPVDRQNVMVLLGVEVRDQQRASHRLVDLLRTGTAGLAPRPRTWWKPGCPGVVPEGEVLEYVSCISTCVDKLMWVYVMMSLGWFRGHSHAPDWNSIQGCYDSCCQRICGFYRGTQLYREYQQFICGHPSEHRAQLNVLKPDARMLTY